MEMLLIQMLLLTSIGNENVKRCNKQRKSVFTRRQKNGRGKRQKKLVTKLLIKHMLCMSGENSLKKVKKLEKP